MIVHTLIYLSYSTICCKWGKTDKLHYMYVQVNRTLFYFKFAVYCHLLVHAFWSRVVLLFSVPSSCTTGDVRLVDGGGEMEGRVEVCRGGVWGAVYDYRWNFNDAQITCRQLGYPSVCELESICVLNIYQLYFTQCPSCNRCSV